MLDPPPFDKLDEPPTSNIEEYPVMLEEESPVILDEELSSNHREPSPTKSGWRGYFLDRPLIQFEMKNQHTYYTIVYRYLL